MISLVTITLRVHVIQILLSVKFILMAIPCIIHMINIFLLSVVHVIDHSPCSTDSNSYIFLYLPFQNLDKFDKNLATEILQWIQTTTGESINTSGDMDNFGAVLKNGMLLCKYVICYFVFFHPTVLI